jgi:hypothetical protein
MLDPAAIAQILTHMRLQPPDSPAERLADLSGKGFPSDDAFPATKTELLTEQFGVVCGIG